MSKNAPVPSLGEATQALGDLISQGTRVGASLLGPLVNSSTHMMRGMMKGVSSTHHGSCCCEIPPPCWEPERLGEVESFVCPGGTATIRLRVTNCNWTLQQVKVVIMGDSSGVTVTPADLKLGPMETGVVAVSYTAPPAGGTAEHDVLIMVHGCKDHFLRWEIEVTKKGINTCCDEVDVDDCPDQIHHWYDHFYCHRHCSGSVITR